MTTAPDWAIGESVGGFGRCPDEIQLFSYSAATWNPHRVHYDLTHARNVEGHEGLLVPGPLLAAWMLELAEGWAGARGDVTRFEQRNLRTAVVCTELFITGCVEAVDPVTELCLWVETADHERVSQAQVWIRPLR